MNRTITNNKSLVFDMSLLEEEYDYETDENQVLRGKKDFEKDLYDAVVFYVQDCPRKFVRNVTHQ